MMSLSEIQTQIESEKVENTRKHHARLWNMWDPTLSEWWTRWESSMSKVFQEVVAPFGEKGAACFKDMLFYLGILFGPANAQCYDAVTNLCSMLSHEDKKKFLDATRLLLLHLVPSSQVVTKYVEAGCMLQGIKDTIEHRVDKMKEVFEKERQCHFRALAQDSKLIAYHMRRWIVLSDQGYKLYEEVLGTNYPLREIIYAFSAYGLSSIGNCVFHPVMKPVTDDLFPFEIEFLCDAELVRLGLLELAKAQDRFSLFKASLEKSLWYSHLSVFRPPKKALRRWEFLPCPIHQYRHIKPTEMSKSTFRSSSYSSLVDKPHLPWDVKGYLSRLLVLPADLLFEFGELASLESFKDRFVNGHMGYTSKQYCQALQNVAQDQNVPCPLFRGCYDKSTVNHPYSGWRMFWGTTWARKRIPHFDSSKHCLPGWAASDSEILTREEQQLVEHEMDKDSLESKKLEQIGLNEKQIRFVKEPPKDGVLFSRDGCWTCLVASQLKTPQMGIDFDMVKVPPKRDRVKKRKERKETRVTKKKREPNEDVKKKKRLTVNDE